MNDKQFEIELTRGEQEVIKQALMSVIKAGDAKKPKENTTEYKILEVNKDILGQILHLQDLDGGKYSVQPTIRAKYSRRELKVLAATMLITAQLQANTLEEYNKRPADHKSFADTDGRRKADYVGRLETRMAETNSILDKVRKHYE